MQIPPQLEQQEAETRRSALVRAFRRNQVFGLLLAAAAIVLWWYIHGNSAWLWTPNWWRP